MELKTNVVKKEFIFFGYDAMTDGRRKICIIAESLEAAKLYLPESFVIERMAVSPSQNKEKEE